MKCEAAQALIARYLRDELTPQQHAVVADHVSDCAECREALAFHRSVESRLDAMHQPPSRLQSRVNEKIAAIESRPAWLTRVFGDPTMKKILISSTAATALLAAFLVMAPRSANASTPLEKFNSMRAALAGAVKNGELTLNVTTDGKGVVTVTGTLDGAPLPAGFPLQVESTIDGKVVDVEVTADLSPENYSTIKYGKNENTLVLVPKANPKTKSEIVLDPKSMRPKTWTTLSAKDGLWEEVSKSEFHPKASAKPMPKSPTAIHAHIKMYISSDASIIVQGG
jgi:hypothetical protein